MSERVRLRPAHTAEALAEIYARPHDHTAWSDHVVRVDMTARWMHLLGGPVDRAADLSCGDGAILKALDVRERVFGDFAPGYEFTGPIEETIEQIAPVDLFVCCETLEHLDDPDQVLKQVRSKARTLLLSTPVENWGDRNPEHYWSWNRDAVEDILCGAGFTVHAHMSLDFRPAGADYCYGVWVAR